MVLKYIGAIGAILFFSTSGHSYRITGYKITEMHKINDKKHFLDFPKNKNRISGYFVLDGFPGTYPEDRTLDRCKVYFRHFYT